MQLDDVQETGNVQGDALSRLSEELIRMVVLPELSTEVSRITTNAQEENEENEENIMDILHNNTRLETYVHNDTDTTVNVCSICHANFNHNDIVRRLRCQHFFHANCIDQWLSHHDNCPICRSHIADSNDTN